MTDLPSALTVRVEAGDVTSGFRCGKHSLDDFFARHALVNDRRGVGCTYVLRRDEEAPADLPRVLGYYTLSMGVLESAQITQVLKERLPKYPIPVGFVGRLASDERTRGRGLRVGETLLMDAIVRVMAAAETIGCVGVALDALDEEAERFYMKYEFATVETSRWPHKMFLPLATAKALVE
jgi:hypothetical protein